MGCRNALGHKPTTYTLACPRAYKLGQKFCINNEVWTCEDRTAKKYDGRFDLFFGYGEEARLRAIKFGKRKLTISTYEGTKNNGGGHPKK